MKSAILWAVRRVCAAVRVNAMPPIWDCLSTSSRRKRTSSFPSGRRCACPMTMASARRLFHSGKLTWAISVGRGLTPPTNIARKRPLRERSCSMISVMLCGSTDSPAKGSTAMGIWLAPPPMISMVSWAWAAPVRKSNAARSVASRVIRGRSIPSSSPLFLRPELERQFPLELIGPVGPGQRRALQYRPLDRVVVVFVAARFSEPRGKHVARGELYDIEDRFRVSLELGRRNDIGPDPRANFFDVAGIAHGSGGRRELLHRLLLLAAAAERLLLLRELLADALRRIELERRLLLLLLLFPLERDVGLRWLVFVLGLGSGLWLDFGLGLRLGRGRLERRQFGPQLGHDRIGVLRLPAQAEDQYGEEHPVHQQRQGRRRGAARFVRRNRVAHCVAGFTSSPSRRMLCRCSSSITFRTAS